MGREESRTSVKRWVRVTLAAGAYTNTHHADHDRDDVGRDDDPDRNVSKDGSRRSDDAGDERSRAPPTVDRCRCQIQEHPARVPRTRDVSPGLDRVNAKVEVIANDKALVAESPMWSASERALYWLDGRSDAIYRIDAHIRGALEVGRRRREGQRARSARRRRPDRRDEIGDRHARLRRRAPSRTSRRRPHTPKSCE